jgi:uncharacterized ion transporter superfamily protein YfcC
MKFAKIKPPNTMIIISSIIVFVAILTYLIPAGEFARIEENGKNLVVPGTFQKSNPNPQFIDSILMAPINGFIAAAEIIGFVLIVGGAFSVFQRTEAVDSAIKSIASAYRKSKLVRLFLIPIFMIIFSLGGAVFGMGEEVIPFILIFVPMALVLGYDTITGVAIPFVGAGAGFAGAFINPFTIGIAQGIAEIPILSGIEYRLMVWLIITLIAILFVSRYAKKIKRLPELSPTFEMDKIKRKKLHIDNIDEYHRIDKKHKQVLIVFLIGLIILVYGVLNHGWFIKEICALFIITGIAVGIVGKLSANDIANGFIEGAKDLIGTAIVIALARGILIIALDGKIIDTILFYLSASIEGMHPVLSSQAMFIVQSFLNFFVPSGSGQAALTMPIMAPLSDLVGVTRQTAVLAFQFGDGFTNMIIPTSAITMGVLSLAEVPWERWAKWILPLEIIFFLLSLILLIPPYLINW